MSQATHLQKLITTYSRRLQKLKETEAMFGINTPPHVSMEIEDIQVELEKLQTDLETEQATLGRQAKRGLPVAEALTQVQQGLAEVKTLLSDLTEKGSRVTIGVVHGDIIGSTIAGGDVHQTNIRAGDNSVVGSSAGGDIITGHDNMVIKPGGDYVGGDKTTLGDVSHAAVAVGAGAQASLTQGISGDSLADFFATVYRQIDNQSGLTAADKEDAKAELAEIEEKVQAGPENLLDSFLTRRLRNLERMTPDIIDVILASLANPAAGLGVVGAKIKAKAKEIQAARA